ncbi:hypothetical protein [Deinococcus hopiensis]|uniref:Uncharacterized protein n=1 Tax=Deinococcus hopiensis KR-140 TaxID=695939 RepID=A0A1W1V0J8_9DEIO|nr:hypothetical protein [Deinococcus hopiensis]SMB86534.1 hypothetical protein SAMN00790413_03839 [Deinococcus hopiensis KR-140]
MEMLITGNDGAWNVETPEGVAFMLATFSPEDWEFTEPGDDGMYALRDGEVVACAPEEVEYILGPSLCPPGVTVDLEALAREAILRVAAGKYLREEE